MACFIYSNYSAQAVVDTRSFIGFHRAPFENSQLATIHHVGPQIHTVVHYTYFHYILYK